MTTEEKLNAILVKCRVILENNSDKLLSRNQPCGCVVCLCEDEVQCHGCGAKNCGTHSGGQMPNPVYDEPKATCEKAAARSTIAAIEWLQAMIDLIAEADPHCPHHSAMQPHITKILTAWPEELL